MSEQLSRILDQAADDVIITDWNEVIVFVNLSFEKTSGYSKEEVIGKTPTIVRSGKHGRAFYNELRDTIRSGRTFRAEFINKRKDGELYHEEQAISPVMDEHGSITHFISIGRDLSRLKRMEENLKGSEERFKLLFEFSPDAYYLSNGFGDFVDVNASTEQVTGYGREELIGLNFFRLGLLPPTEVGKAAAMLARIARGEPADAGKFKLHKKNGSVVPVEMRMYPVRMSEEDLVLGIVHDLSGKSKGI